jgi:hypothetical protein
VAATGSIAFGAMTLGSPATWLILIGFLVNVAAWPLASWVPDAYPSASWSGTVFLSSFTTKAAVLADRSFAGTEILVPVGLAMISTARFMRRASRHPPDRRLCPRPSWLHGYGRRCRRRLAINGAAAHAVSASSTGRSCSWSPARWCWRQGGHVRRPGGLWQAMPFTAAAPRSAPGDRRLSADLAMSPRDDQRRGRRCRGAGSVVHRHAGTPPPSSMPGPHAMAGLPRWPEPAWRGRSAAVMRLAMASYIVTLAIGIFRRHSWRSSPDCPDRALLGLPCGGAGATARRRARPRVAWRRDHPITGNDWRTQLLRVLDGHSGRAREALASGAWACAAPSLPPRSRACWRDSRRQHGAVGRASPRRLSRLYYL